MSHLTERYGDDGASALINQLSTLAAVNTPRYDHFREQKRCKPSATGPP